MQRTHLFTALALIAATAIGVARLGGSPSEPAATAAAPPAIRVEASGGEGRRSEVLVHVAGAVRRPGVYRLREGMRIDDALRLAGGPKRRADLAAVNLAAKVQDGRQVLVPERGRAGAPEGSAASGAGEGTGGAGAPGAPVNLNSATIEQLDALEGIGPATAQSILDYREEHGGFGSVEELGQIPGIGEKRLATLREGVTV